MAIVVKRWDNVVGHGFHFTQLDVGNYRWSLYDGSYFGTHPDGLDAARFVAVWGASSDVGRAINGTLPPTWVDPQWQAANVGSAIAAAQPVDLSIYTPEVGDVVEFEEAGDPGVRGYGHGTPRWDYEIDLGASGRFVRGPVTAMEASKFHLQYKLGHTWSVPLPGSTLFAPNRPGWPVVVERKGVAVGKAASVTTTPASVRCKHNGKNPIAGITATFSPYMVNRSGRTVTAYAAPVVDQRQALKDELVRAALRGLREVPMCNVTGERVSVVAVDPETTTATMFASFWCPSCGGKK